MNASELDAAILAALDGETDPAAEAALIAALRHDDAAQRRFAEIMHLHGNLPTVLDELASEGRARARLAAAGAPMDRGPAHGGTGTLRRRRARPWWRRQAPAFAAVAALLILGAGAFIIARRQPVAVVPDRPASGVATIAEHAHATTIERGTLTLSAGGAALPLAAHDVVTTAADGTAELTLGSAPGLSRVRLLAGTRLRWWQDGGERLELGAGRLVCTIAPQPPGAPLRIRTAQAEITVHGTVFSLAALPGTTRIAMTSGTVAFRRLQDGVTMEIGPGQAALAGIGSAGDPGLVAAWPCDEGRGTLLAALADGGPAARTQGPASWTQEHGANILSLASGASVAIDETPALDSDALTVMAWMRAAVVPERPTDVVSLLGRGESRARVYDIRLAGGQVIAAYAHPDGYLRSSAVVRPGAWFHVALCYDGEHLRLVMNGRTVGSAEVRFPPGWNAGSALRIGGTAVGRSFAGDVAQVRLYDRALSEEEIAQVMNATDVRDR